MKHVLIIERSDVNKDLKRLQKNNLNKEYKNFINNPDFCHQDILRNIIHFVSQQMNQKIW